MPAKPWGSLLVALWFACSRLAVLNAASPSPSPAEVDRLMAAIAPYQSGQSMASLRQLEGLVRQANADSLLQKNLAAAFGKLLAGPSTPEARQFACEQLVALGSDDALPAIAALLKSDETAALACQTLGAFPSPKATALLLEALPGLHGTARIQAMTTLGEHPEAGSVAPLARLARNPDPEVAAAAITALGKFDDDAARETISQLRREASPALAQAVAEASLHAAERLADEGKRQAAAAIYEELLTPAQADNVRRGALEALFRLDADGGQQRILQILHQPDALLKPVAIAAIAQLPGEAASTLFARELPAMPPQEQAWLIEVLANRPDAAARSALERSLDSPAAAVRRAAIEALGKYGSTTSVPALCRAAARAPEPREGALIEKALTTLAGGTNADQAILVELKRAPAAGQLHLIPVLARRGSRAAIPSLLDLTDREDTAPAAFRALGTLARFDDVDLLLGKLTHLQASIARAEAESAVAQSLLATENRARRSAMLCPALSKATALEARCSLLRLLPTCADPPALAALQSARHDLDPRVRDASVRSLADWPDLTAWDSLVEIRRAAENPVHGALAMDALVRLAEAENGHPDARLIALYGTLVELARQDGDRRLVLGALSGVAHPDALPLALSMVELPNVKAEAQLAVRKIAEAVRKENPQAAASALRKLSP